MSDVQAAIAQIQAALGGDSLADELDRDEALERIIRTTALHGLVAVRQRGDDPETARYTLVFEDGREIKIGTINTLWSQAELGKVLFVTLRKPLPPIKRNDWIAVIGCMALIVEVEEVEGERFQDDVAEWLQRYLRNITADRAGAIPNGMPFRDGADVYITASGFANLIRRDFSEQVKLRELREALSDLGFERVTLHYTGTGDKRSSTSYYRGRPPHAVSLKGAA